MWLFLVSKFHLAFLSLRVEGGMYVLQDPSHFDGKDWLPASVTEKTLFWEYQIPIAGTLRLMQIEASKPLTF